MPLFKKIFSQLIVNSFIRELHILFHILIIDYITYKHTCLTDQVNYYMSPPILANLPEEQQILPHKAMFRPRDIIQEN